MDELEDIFSSLNNDQTLMDTLVEEENTKNKRKGLKGQLKAINDVKRKYDAIQKIVEGFRIGNERD